VSVDETHVTISALILPGSNPSYQHLRKNQYSLRQANDVKNGGRQGREREQETEGGGGKVIAAFPSLPHPFSELTLRHCCRACRPCRWQRHRQRQTPAPPCRECPGPRGFQSRSAPPSRGCRAAWPWNFPGPDRAVRPCRKTTRRIFRRSCFQRRGQ